MSGQYNNVNNTDDDGKYLVTARLSKQIHKFNSRFYFAKWFMTNVRIPIQYVCLCKFNIKYLPLFVSFIILDWIRLDIDEWTYSDMLTYI